MHYLHLIFSLKRFGEVTQSRLKMPQTAAITESPTAKLSHLEFHLILASTPINTSMEYIDYTNMRPLSIACLVVSKRLVNTQY